MNKNLSNCLNRRGGETNLRYYKYKNTDKNINRIKGLLNLENKFASEIANSRMKKIKPLIKFKPTNKLVEKDFQSMIRNIQDDKLREQYVDSIIIYNSWMHYRNNRRIFNTDNSLFNFQLFSNCNNSSIRFSIWRNNFCT